MNWKRVEDSIEELENEQREVLEEYNGTVELIQEALEEQDIVTFEKYSTDIRELLQKLNEIREAIGHIGSYIDNAVDDAIMERNGID